MHVSDIDLKLLRVFHAVVEAGGFSNAQTVLNVSPSTISSHMSQLEARVGFCLCERGRSGFSLTQKGEQFHRHMLEFFGAVQALESNAQILRGSLVGQLRIGIIDNLVTDAQCPLHRALATFAGQPDTDVRLSLVVMSPEEIEAALLEGSLDVGVGISYQRRSGLRYQTLYRERDVLVCNADHPLAEVTEPHTLAHAIPGAKKVARNFMQKQEFPFVHDGDRSVITTVTSVEAAAFLILNCPFIGFLPRHYAKQWLEDGQLVALGPEKFVRYSNVSLILADRQVSPSHALAHFLQCLEMERALAAEQPIAPL